MRNTCTNNRTGHRTGGTQVQITELGTEHVKLSVQLLELRIGHRAARRRKLSELGTEQVEHCMANSRKVFKSSAQVLAVLQKLYSIQYIPVLQKLYSTYRYSSANYELLSS